MNTFNSIKILNHSNDRLLIEIFRETRTGNNLYQELSFQDSEALGDVDEGADITGNIF